MPAPTDSEVVSNLKGLLIAADTAWKELSNPEREDDSIWKETWLDRINSAIDLLKQAPSGDPDCPNVPPPPVLT